MEQGRQREGVEEEEMGQCKRRRGGGAANITDRALEKDWGRQCKIPCNLTRCVRPAGGADRGRGVAVSAGMQECIILRQRGNREREGGRERLALSSVFLALFMRLLRLRIEIKTRRMQRKYLM